VSDDHDELLEHLRDADPGRETGDEPAVRASVKRRAIDAATEPPRRRWTPRRTVVIAVGAGALAAVAAGLALFGDDGGIAPGPERALAIERGPKGVTLTITDPDANAGEMNAELAQAGIDRVRVISVPGSRSHVGTWAGTIDLMANCEGGPTRAGFGVRIAYHPDSGLPAASGLVHMKLPEKGDIRGSVTLQSGAGKRAIVSTEDTLPKYGPAILIAVHPRSDSESPGAKDVTADDLIALGGVFKQYGDAISDGFGECSELGLSPMAPPTFPPAEGDWAVVRIVPTEAGEAAMTQSLHDQGINGRFKVIPAQPEEAGGYLLGWARRPAFPPDIRIRDNVFDVIPGDPDHPGKPSAKFVALRLDAFAAYPEDHWVFWVGRHAHDGEPPLVVGRDGPVNAAAAWRNRCKGIGGVVSTPSGRHWCTSSLLGQVPSPDDLATADN
jgi:hypothetical protein